MRSAEQYQGLRAGQYRLVHAGRRLMTGTFASNDVCLESGFVTIQADDFCFPRFNTANELMSSYLAALSVLSRMRHKSTEPERVFVMGLDGRRIREVKQRRGREANKSRSEGLGD